MNAGDKVKLTAKGVQYLHRNGRPEATMYDTGTVVKAELRTIIGVSFDGISPSEETPDQPWWMAPDEIELVTAEQEASHE